MSRYILARSDDSPEYFGDTTGAPNDMAYYLAGLPTCRVCGSPPAPHALPTIGRWLVCSGPQCDRESEAAPSWQEAAKLWEQGQCIHSWFAQENALGQRWFQCCHCGARMEEGKP